MAGGHDRGGTLAVVIVALTGLLSTVSAALLSGQLANDAVETQLYIARDNAIKDQRRQIYVDYLRATAKACELAGSPGGSQKAVEDAAVDVLNQQARVLLVAGPAMERAVDNFSKELLPDPAQGRRYSDPCDLGAYRELRDAFLTAAKPDLQE